MQKYLSFFSFTYHNARTGSCPSASTPTYATHGQGKYGRALSSIAFPTVADKYEDTVVVTAMVYDTNGNSMTGGAVLAALDENCEVGSHCTVP